LAGGTWVYTAANVNYGVSLFRLHSDSRAFARLPWAGQRLAPRLLAEWGDDRGRYTDAANVQALAGTSPVPFQSGNFAKAHRRYACNKPLRHALQQFAWKRQNSEYKAISRLMRRCQATLQIN